MTAFAVIIVAVYRIQNPHSEIRNWMGVDTLDGWNIIRVGPIAQLEELPAHNR